MIEVRDIRKRYRNRMAVDGLSFVVHPGTVTGLLGPNGSGKSTTMRLILGLDRPDHGYALVGGLPYRSLRWPLRHLGTLLDANTAHPARTAVNHLRWIAHSNGIPVRRVEEVLGRVGLADVARQPVGRFSLGMRQRLGIAAALLGDPPVLMFDEPVNGLDPEGVDWLRELFVDLAGQGRTILLSSHHLGEIARTAGRLIVLGEGRLLAEGLTDEVVRAGGGGGLEVAYTQLTAESVQHRSQPGSRR